MTQEKQYVEAITGTTRLRVANEILEPHKWLIGKRVHIFPISYFDIGRVTSLDVFVDKDLTASVGVRVHWESSNIGGYVGDDLSFKMEAFHNDGGEICVLDEDFVNPFDGNRYWESGKCNSLCPLEVSATGKITAWIASTPNGDEVYRFPSGYDNQIPDDVGREPWGMLNE